MGVLGDISALIAAVIGGVILLRINSYSFIRKKTKAESIQKLELNSMIEIINGTEDLKSAIDEFNFIIIKLSNAIKIWISCSGSQEAMDLTRGVEKEFIETSKKSNSIISKFIITLKKDMIINGEDQTVREEIKKIRDIHERMEKSITEIDIKYNTPDMANNILKQILEDLDEANVEEAIEESIENIWKIYTEKLNKKQIGWLDKLLNCFKRR